LLEQSSPRLENMFLQSPIVNFKGNEKRDAVELLSICNYLLIFVVSIKNHVFLSIWTNLWVRDDYFDWPCTPIGYPIDKRT
jgi:hypothetical protein